MASLDDFSYAYMKINTKDSANLTVHVEASIGGQHYTHKYSDGLIMTLPSPNIQAGYRQTLEFKPLMTARCLHAQTL